ncbi:lysine--tRNA ligase [Patescibacteria group bacterium]|nr:lysine--tRNA ligase [Patescibacteria group bacterium]MBU1730041.1 lysine--tRNA ligase [Patescibacteria group bacterium]
MASLEELRKERLRKLEILQESGMIVYPSLSSRELPLREVINRFDELSKQKSIIVAGRILALRGQGAILFLDLYDGTGRLQGLFKADSDSNNNFELFNKTVDIGDFVELKGTLFITKRGEKTLQVSEWKMLTKSIQPLPDKWHGITDEETRYRKRYLDILFNPELRGILEKKTLFWDVTRAFMKDKGFFEVETPTLELTTGGAEAHPFQTHHRDFDLDLYLRISVGELWQKRLMVAGFEKTFEVGRVYRNEGSSPNHLQEFTNMEFYWAYADYEKGMRLTQELYQTIAEKVFGTMKFTTGKYNYDLSGDWPQIDYQEEVLRQTGIDVITATKEIIIAKLKDLGVVYDGNSRERLTDTLWKYCRKNISGPVFLINHPKIISPLAKSMQNRPDCTERFQIIIAGAENGNGYSELNNPIEQRKRFEEQRDLLLSGDTEAMMPDWEFVEALEHGMPPTCGFGFGERLFSFMVNKPVRETQFFPLLKPKGL